MGRERFRPAILLTLFAAVACASPVVPTDSASPSAVALPTATAGPATTVSPVPATAPRQTPAASPPTTPSTTPSVVQTPTGFACTSEDPALATYGRLTVGFSEPAVPPWFGGDAAIAYLGEPEGTAWEVSDPYSGEGFEGALAYAIAAQLGFGREDVQWLIVDLTAAVAAGPKQFDFYISQAVPAIPDLANVSFSRTYYELNYAILGLFENPIADLTTIDELRTFRLGAVDDSAEQLFLANVVQPTTPLSTFADIEAARSALELDDIDGLVVDLPTAFRLRDEEIPGAEVVGQFEMTARELGFVNSVLTDYAAILEQASPLIRCVTAALQALDDAGSLDALRRTWLADRANAPILE